MVSLSAVQRGEFKRVRLETEGPVRSPCSHLGKTRGSPEVTLDMEKRQEILNAFE